jgi:3-hydroxyisobutyrate dehydrogenase-like beta-hydroxyacid dehydrogenase
MAIRAGFIGLGNLGAPMARRLAAAGFEPVVFDVREEPRRELARSGARAAGSVAEVAGAEVIGVCVRDDRDVRDVMLGKDGVVAHARAGTVIALHSTILPSTVREVAGAASARGLGVVDAPVTGGSAGAESGALTCMVGGAPELLERCRPVLSAFAKKIVHTGELGSGAAAKLCNNLIGYLGFLAAFEAAALAKGAGLPFESLVEVTRSSGHLTDIMLSFFGFRQRIDAEPDEPSLEARARSFTDLAEKDLAVTLAFARECGVELPGTEVCRELMGRVYGVRELRAGRE